MELLKINNTTSFGMERLGAKLRLIVFDKKEELACRKETFSNLQRFVHSNETHAFKGRLQLFKKPGSIIIVVKGEELGIISAKNFEKSLRQFKKDKNFNLK